MYTEEELNPLKPEVFDKASQYSESFQDPPESAMRSLSNRLKALLFLLSLSLLANLFFILIITVDQLHNGPEKDEFASGFETDFQPAISAIKTHKVLFQGSPEFLPDGTMYHPEMPNQPKYIGEPSQEIDDNWEVLTRARYWTLFEEEAIATFGKSEYQKFWDPKTQGYIAGFDAQHTLHCLNFLRKSFYPEYYNNMSAVHGAVHRDHCIDHLRQIVQCQGDITPIPTRFREGIGRNYIDSNRWHTCRDWSSIAEWVENRYIQSEKDVAEQTDGQVRWIP